jgi:phosphoribosyl 1,2-cyclic phosphate phosphodiesterase
MRVTVLGCGPSTGVPVIGGNWGRCDPGDRRNRRRRVSVLVEVGSVVILIDTSPDLREQLLDADAKWIDAVVLTHAHADHLHGIDDLRSVNRLMRSAISLYADGQTLVEIARRFGYVLKPVEEAGRFYKPTLTPHEIVGPFEMSRVPPPGRSQ